MIRIATIEAVQKQGLNESSSPVKLVLAYVGYILGFSALNVYRQALSHCLDLRINLHAVSIVEEEQLKRFYKWENPSKDPQFLSFESPRTMKTIALVAKTHIAIYQLVRGRLPLKLVDTTTKSWLFDSGQGYDGCLSLMMHTPNKPTKKAKSTAFIGVFNSP